jgi:hypothetical protein
MSVNIKGIEQTTGSLKREAEWLGLDLLGEIIRLGRMIAVECAKMTQPWGLTKASQEQGQKAVAKDISKVFTLPSPVYLELRRRSPEAAEQYWVGYKKRNMAAMRKAFYRASYSIDIARTPRRELHDAARQYQGRVRLAHPVQLVLDKNALARYKKERQKAVGYVKAGWARAADELGGHRGIPAWASSKQRGATGRAIIERNALHPKVTIENTIPYVMDNLDPMEVNRALHDAYGKLMKYLSYRKFSDD